MTYIRGPFENFLDSPYYSELELCGASYNASLTHRKRAADRLLQASGG